MSIVGRPRWHPPPPPSPKILHLPIRRRRKTNKQLAGKIVNGKESESRRNHRGKLETLFDQERVFSRTVPIVLFNSGDCERRERVEEFEDLEMNGGFEEKWRFQAEILRAECNLLRMERDIALKKLERNRVQMERTLQFAIDTLISGRKKIYEGKSVGVVLEEEIGDLEDKLEKLQRSSGTRDFETRKCINFDKQVSVLRKQMEKLGGISVDGSNEIREMAEASLTINTNSRIEEGFVSDRRSRFTDVEILRRKMEGLSKGMLEKMEEEYRSMLSTANTSAATSASSSRRIEFPDSSSTLIRQLCQEKVFRAEKVCSGHCKAIVRKIIEQVRSETDQWSQMQDMLVQVREEMEELQASRAFWEDRALNSEDHIQVLQSTVKEWRNKAWSSEAKVNELQKQVSDLGVELERLKTEKNTRHSTIKTLPPLPAESQKENEKRVLICRLKENHQNCSNGNNGIVSKKRSPLQDIKNTSPLLRQSSRTVFPLYCSVPSLSNESL